MVLPDISDRIKVGPVSTDHLEKAIASGEFPFDNYGDDFFKLYFDSLEILDLQNTKLNDLDKGKEVILRSLSGLKNLKNKINNFDLNYDKSFQFKTESGLVYDYNLIKRIYNYIYYDAIKVYSEGFYVFQGEVYDRGQTINIRELFKSSNDFLHNEYLNLKNNKIFLSEVSVSGDIFSNRHILEWYILQYNQQMVFINNTFEKINWFNNEELEKFYAIEYLKNLSILLEKSQSVNDYETITPFLTSIGNTQLDRLEKLWKRKTGQTNKGFNSRFEIFNPKDLTDKDMEFLSRIYFVYNYQKQLKYFNMVASTNYDKDGNLFEGGNFLSYESFYELSLKFMAFHESTLKNYKSYSSGADFKRIKNFIPTLISEYHSSDGYWSIEDVGINLISSISQQYLSYALDFKENGYTEQYTKLIELSIGFYDPSFSMFSRIDKDNTKYHDEVIDRYVSSYFKAVEEEIILYMWYGLYNDSNNSELVGLSRKKIKEVKNLAEHFSVSDKTRNQILYIQDKFELRIGLSSDIIKQNKLDGFDPFNDFKFYKDYFEKMKETKNSEPDWYYPYFSGIIQRHGYKTGSKIFTDKEIDEIYSYIMNLSYNSPSNDNLQHAAQLDYELFGPTEFGLSYLDYGFSQLSKRATVKEVQEFPERFSTLAWFMKRYTIFQFFLDKKDLDNDKYKDILESGAHRNIDELLSSQAITSDNVTKSIMHTKKQDLSILDYTKYTMMDESDSTYFGLRYFQFLKYGINQDGPQLVHPDSLLIVSYSFSSEFDRINPNFMINTIGLYHETSPEHYMKSEIVGADNIYEFKDVLDISKSVLRNNLIDISNGSNNNKIYDMLIKPIESDLKNYKNIIIIPDPFIENFPLESIKDKDGNFLVEKYNISYANSYDQLFNDFFRERFRVDSINSSIFGDVNYDSNPNYETLKWSDNEIDYINENSLFKGDLFSGDNASETNFKNLLNDLNSPTRLHLSLHAYNDPIDIRNSAIMFAKDEENDGYLRYSEVKELDFSNINLIVLSACETNTGKTLNNFGQQTFQHLMKMNGADNVIATLWKIDDEATYYFMKELYDSISIYSYDTSLALSNAKRNFISKYPKYRNPYYWSGFVSYGF
ncbi:CHAT domain-containing protein [Candidatus Marinimicrobia bacterium]|nr:CHAT domain-containing protein [Candidatus Neomarinimicrobiota bacterium]